MMKRNLLFSALLLFSTSLIAQVNQVSVVKNDDGFTLEVNGDPIMINGMNWDYFPVGSTNPWYNFWGQSDDFIKAALDSEMTMLKNMGVNVIRQYLGVKPRWVQYIYEKYGIWTMINTTFGRESFPRAPKADETIRTGIKTNGTTIDLIHDFISNL